MLTATSNWITANSKLEKQVVYRILIDGYYRTLSNYDNGVDDPWLGDIDDWSQTVNDLDGGADQETLCFYVQDHRFQLTADMGAGMVFEGKQVELQMGFTSLTGTTDYLTLWVGYVDQVDSANANQDYYFQCSDITSRLAQVIFQTGDNGGPTSAQNIKTVKGHPLDILLTALLYEAKVDPDLVDIDKITQYRDGPFGGLEFLFRLQQAPATADFIKNQILKPLGGYLWISQGKITVNFFYPLASATPVQTIGPDDWTSIPTAEQTDMVNTVQFQFDKDDTGASSGGNYRSQSTQEYGPAVLKYGIYGEHVISSDGMRAGLQGYLIAWLVSRLIFGRYGLKNLKFDQNAAEGILSLMLLQAGDIVAVTHPQIPDRQAGVMGITGKLFEVLTKKINFAEGRVTLTMIDAGYLSGFGFFKITPDSETDYVSASPTDKAKYLFQTNDSGKYSNGNAGNTLG